MKSRMVAAVVAVVALSASLPGSAETLKQELPYPKAQVYAGLLQVLPEAGFKIQDQDAVISRVTARAGMSAFSVGERMSIAVTSTTPTSSVLEYDGSRVLSSNVVAENRVLQHFNKIVLMLSRYLQDNAGAPASADAPK